MSDFLEHLRWAVLNKETLSPQEKFQIADILEKYSVELQRMKTRERFENESG